MNKYRVSELFFFKLRLFVTMIVDAEWNLLECLNILNTCVVFFTRFS